MDLIANIGNCSNRQVCDHLVLQGCQSGWYRVLLGPMSAGSVDVPPRSPQSPVADFLSFQGVCADSVGLLEIHRWSGTAWTHNEACAIEADLREVQEEEGGSGCPAGAPICSAEMERKMVLLWARR